MAPSRAMNAHSWAALAPTTADLQQKRVRTTQVCLYGGRLRRAGLRLGRRHPRTLCSAGCSFGRSSLSRPCGAVPPSLSSPVRSFMPSAWDDDPDESPFLNAVCYPETILEDSLEDCEDRHISVTTTHPSCAWPFDPLESELPSVEIAGLLPLVVEGIVKPGFADAAEDADGVSQQMVWRRGAATAVLRAEENYRKAWRDFQLAEMRLLSTRQVAAELNALPEVEAVSDHVLDGGNNTEEAVDHQDEDLVDLGWDDGVWCIEACAPDPETIPQFVDTEIPSERNSASSFLAEEAVSNAEGAISCSRTALDSAARDLIARLREEEELQAQVMDHHIDVLDQGAQHQVARWLVDEMEAAACAEGDSGGEERDSDTEGSSSLSIAVPLDLDLAMKGYDKHALRFLCHLPYDQVLKIRTNAPSKHADSLQESSATADTLERILAQPPAQPALASPGKVFRDGPSAGSNVLLESLDYEPQVLELDLAEVVTGDEGGENVLPRPMSELGSNTPSKQGPQSAVSGRKNGAGRKYHSKLVLLGCAVCSLAAYMVANFELLVLAKDVSVILTAMSIAFIAAQFVWRSSDKQGALSSAEGMERGSACSEGRGMMLPEDRSRDQSQLQSVREEAAHVQRGGQRQHSSLYKRSPTWDHIIWLIGAFAVVLSLSTMVALACKAAQSGLTSLSTVACTLLLKLVPRGGSPGAAALMSSPASVSALVQHVSTSLWLVIGGEILSSGVESLGSAAAWAMLLLCVAFSIASAPVCIASSTSRRVNELLALAKSHS